MALSSLQRLRVKTQVGQAAKSVGWFAPPHCTEFTVRQAGLHGLPTSLDSHPTTSVRYLDEELVHLISQMKGLKHREVKELLKVTQQQDLNPCCLAAASTVLTTAQCQGH